MKKVRSSQKKPYNDMDPRFLDFEYVDTERIRKIINDGAMFFENNQFITKKDFIMRKTQRESDKILETQLIDEARAEGDDTVFENKEDNTPLQIISSNDIPFNAPELLDKNGKPDKLKNTQQLEKLIQDTLNGNKGYSRSNKEESWPERELKKSETLKYIKAIFEESVEYFEDYLGLDVGIILKKEIKDMGDISSIIKFISHAHLNKSNKPRGLIVCVLCKIAETIHYTKSRPEILQGLEEKTIGFGNHLVGEMNLKDITTPQDFDATIEKTNGVSVSYERNTFRLKDLEIDTKQKYRIYSKLLRIVDKDLDDIVKDGVRVRLFVEKKEVKKAIKWLESLGFKKKQSTNTTRAPEYDSIHYMVGMFQGSYVEIQVTDERVLQRGVWGVLRHEVYEEIQKMIIISRLFGGSISDARMKTRKNALIKDYTLDPDELDKRIETVFFKNRDDKRWYTYEYEMRMQDKGVYEKNRFNKGVLDHFLGELREYKNLGDVSSNDLSSILKTSVFPKTMSYEHVVEFVSYMNTKKGIPHTIYLLEKQLKSRIINKIGDMFLESGVMIESNLLDWVDDNGLLTLEENLFWDYLKSLISDWQALIDSYRNLLEKVKKLDSNASLQFDSLDHFSKTQKIAIKVAIKDSSLKGHLDGIVLGLVTSLVGDNKKFIEKK